MFLESSQNVSETPPRPGSGIIPCSQKLYMLVSNNLSTMKRSYIREAASGHYRPCSGTLWHASRDCSLPVAKQWSQHHEAVFHQGHNLLDVGAFQQQFTTGLEVREAEDLAAPLLDDLLEFSLNVLLLHRRDTDVLQGGRYRESIMDTCVEWFTRVSLYSINHER